MKTDRQTLTQSEYHLQTYNTHTIIKGPPQEVPTTILQHSYTKGTPCHPPPTPNPEEVPPTILQHSYTKGTPHPIPPYPQPTASTTHHLTTFIHPQSYNTHTLKGPTTPHPLSPTHRKYHPPSYNTHRLKGPPTPLPPTHRKYHTPSYNTYTLKGPLPPTPLPPTHRKYHPPSYNTHTLKGPPIPNPQEVPPTILQHSYTHNLTTLIH